MAVDCGAHLPGGIGMLTAAPLQFALVTGTTLLYWTSVCGIVGYVIDRSVFPRYIPAVSLSALANILIISAVQLLAAEGLSIWLFTRGAHLLPYPVYTGYMAPIWLFFAPILALHDGDYPGVFQSLLVDIVFLSIMIRSIRENSRLASSICLFIFSLISIGLTLGGV